jgi:hypothetical protein
VYASLSSLLGVSVVLDPQLLRLMTFGSLALALSSLASMALRRPMWRRRWTYLPLAVGAAGCIGVWLGKFVVASEPLTYVSLLGLILASLAARRGSRRSGASGVLAAVQN